MHAVSRLPSSNRCRISSWSEEISCTVKCCRQTSTALFGSSADPCKIRWQGNTTKPGSPSGTISPTVRSAAGFSVRYAHAVS